FAHGERGDRFPLGEWRQPRVGPGVGFGVENAHWGVSSPGEDVSHPEHPARVGSTENQNETHFDFRAGRITGGTDALGTPCGASLESFGASALYSVPVTIDRLDDGRVRITPPLTEDDVRGLAAGDVVVVRGTVFGARDAAHKRMVEMLDAGE